MHQSGHERAQSMQTVQLTSRRAMTPRDLAVGASFSWGYCTVAGPPPIFRGVTVCASSLKVTPRPFRTPGTIFAISGRLSVQMCPQARSSVLLARREDGATAVRRCQDEEGRRGCRWAAWRLGGRGPLEG